MAHKEQNTGKNDAPGTPDMSKKRDGVTSAFSAATSRNYSGEDIQTTAADSGNDTDKMRSGRQENEDESKLFND